MIYALALIKPFVPVVNYLINEKYIAANLCVNKSNPMMHCNGKCYMAKQLKKAADDNAKKNFPITTNSNNGDTLYFPEATHFIAYYLPNYSSSVIYFYSENISTKAISKIFHPPTFTA